MMQDTEYLSYKKQKGQMLSGTLLIRNVKAFHLAVTITPTSGNFCKFYQISVGLYPRSRNIYESPMFLLHSSVFGDLIYAPLSPNQLSTVREQQSELMLVNGTNNFTLYLNVVQTSVSQDASVSHYDMLGTYTFLVYN